MKYEKQSWTDGQTTVCAANMQHIEQGIVDAVTDIEALKGGISDGSANLFSMDGETENQKLFNAINEGGRYSGGNNTLTLTYKDCDPPGGRMWRNVHPSMWYSAPLCQSEHWIA